MIRLSNNFISTVMLITTNFTTRYYSFSYNLLANNYFIKFWLNKSYSLKCYWIWQIEVKYNIFKDSIIGLIKPYQKLLKSI